MVINLSYKDAGVDIDKANKAIESLKTSISETYNKYVFSGVGGFAGLITVDLSEFIDPIISISTDGVGTKLLLAREYERLEGIGIDLVAMNVDDVICSGARPIAFVDYYACGKLQDNIYFKVLNSIIEGCKIANVALIGGETAEMPGLYNNQDFDLSGTAIGIASKKNVLPKDVKEGDKLIGLESSGFHSNGFSLIRRIVKDKRIDLTKEYSFSKPLIDLILEPTFIYCNYLYSLVDKGLVKGLAHITGGGIIENTLRVTQGRNIHIYKENIKPHDFMEFIIREGKISEEESFRVFNMGIGMVIICEREDIVIDELKRLGFTKRIEVIGKVL